MSTIKKPNPMRKKQIKQFIISLGASLAALLIILFVFNLFNNNGKLSIEQTKKGTLLLEQKDYVQAEAAFRKAVSADEKNPDARKGLLSALDLQNKYDDMIPIALKGVELLPGNIDFYRFAIQGYVKSNKLEKALKFISEITNQPVLLNLKEERPTPIKLSPNPGSYDHFITVTMTTDAKSSIYYTTDGTLPDLNAKKYTSPITVDKEKLNIRAIAINESSIISDEVSVNYSIYNDNQRYTFADTKIEQIVRSVLGKQTGDILYRDIIKITRLSNYDSAGKPLEGYIRKLDDLLAMKSLNELSLNNEPVLTGFSVFSSLSSLKIVNLNGCGIDDTDFKDICSAKWINSLKLDKNQITDLTQLTQLDALQYFSASDNKIVNVEPLGVLAGLLELNLSKNSLSNIETIGKLTALKALDLSNNTITSINPFLSLTSVNELRIAGNQISDISGISVLSSLKTLNLSSNNLVSIAPITGLSSVSNLDLSYNNVSDLSPLSNLSLTQLTLNNCGIVDLSPLSSIGSLKVLDIKNNTISTNISPYINDITDLAPLSRLQSLESVNLNLNSNLTSLKPLRYCYSLKTIYCINCPNVDTNDFINSTVQVFYK